MKLKHIIASYILLAPIIAAAQSGLKCPPIDGSGFGTQKVDLTLGVGPTLLYGDISPVQNNMGFGVVLKGDYNIYRGLYGGIEFQAGKLLADGANDDRFVRNRYIAGSINATVYPYRFFVTERELFIKAPIHKFLLNGLYVGVGLGIINNRYTDVYRDEPNRSPKYNGPHSLDNEGQKVWSSLASDMLMPVLNLGVAVPFNKYTSGGRGYFSGVLNAQFNYSNGENLDGYDPLDANGQRASQHNDMYTFTYFGLRYTF